MRGLLGGLAAAAVVIGGLYLLDVFTWAGLAYTVGLEDGATLRWPAVTRAVTVTLAIGAAATATVALVAHLDWRDAVYAPESRADRWAIVPRSILRRAAVRWQWWLGGVTNWRRQTARRIQLARPMLEAGDAVHAARDRAARDDQAA